MTAGHRPLMLRAWLLATRGLAGPLRLVWRRLHVRMGSDPARFAERLGQPGQKVGEPVIWIHAASLGEVAQIGGVVRALIRSGRKVLVTTTTQAGADWAMRELPEAVHQFAPMDTPGAVDAFLSAWDIAAAVFIEGDFGPRLTLEAQGRGIPMVLLNARHSRTRDRFGDVFGALLSGFAHVTCRSETVAASMRALGVSAGRVTVLPDLRIATERLSRPPDQRDELADAIGTRPVWLAASTHAADEPSVLSAHASVLEHIPGALLILAPRHPARADAVQAEVRRHGLTVARRSTGDLPGPDTQVYLADTLGELGIFFTLAPVAFLGGSFGEEGGHNPYEPASFGTAILSGPGVDNFADAYTALTDIGAALRVGNAGALADAVTELVGSDRARRMGTAGASFMAASESSLSQTVALIETTVEGRN